MPSYHTHSAYTEATIQHMANVHQGRNNAFAFHLFT